MAPLVCSAAPRETNSVEQNPIQEMLRGRSIDFLSPGTCPGYQEEVACCGPWLEGDGILQHFTSSQILDSRCNVHKSLQCFSTPEELWIVKTRSQSELHP